LIRAPRTRSRDTLATVRTLRLWLTVGAPRVAAFVDKILKGANPGDLALEQPTRYYVAVNLKTARRLA